MLVLTILVSLAYLGGIQTAIVDVQPYASNLVKLHNNYRRQAGAANMQKMVWNETLSNEAEAWVRRCDFRHENSGRGENLAYDTNALTTEERINNALESWHSERSYYTLGQYSCGSSCHYTQMVWHSTTKVGCAMNICPSLYAFGKWLKNAWYLACFYYPRGNWNGEKPYERGAPCSQCLGGQSCENGLCTDRGNSGGFENEESGSQCEDSNPNCSAWEQRGECQKNPLWMLVNCRKSCRQCTEATACADQFDCCTRFARQGFCRRYRSFMNDNCKASCSLCWVSKKVLTLAELFGG